MKATRRCPDCCRIVLTGGPGGGKTTAADLFRREIGERVVIVPEAATILFQGGFPRSREPHASRFAASPATPAAWHQRSVEETVAALGVTIADHGRNELTEGEAISPWTIFLGQFKNLIVWILIVTGVISYPTPPALGRRWNFTRRTRRPSHLITVSW